MSNGIRRSEMDLDGLGRNHMESEGNPPARVVRMGIWIVSALCECTLGVPQVRPITDVFWGIFCTARCSM